MNPIKSTISFQEFQNLDIRVCKILSIEKVPDTDKLYKMEIDTGLDKRLVVSAIADRLPINVLEGAWLPFVLNLDPRVIKGIKSEAMIILGETVNAKDLVLLSPVGGMHPDDEEEIDKYLIGATII